MDFFLSSNRWGALVQPLAGAICQWGSSMLAKGQAALTEIHVNTGTVTSGRWPTVTPGSYKCQSRACTFPALWWLKSEVSLKRKHLCFSFLQVFACVVEPFLSAVTSHLFCVPGCYARAKGNQSGLQEVSWCFSCVAMVTESVSCRAAVEPTISCQTVSLQHYE